MITVYLYYFIGIYIISVLLYSDSCMYWCLAYVCEGISTLRMYLVVASLYLWDRDVTSDLSLSIPFDVSVPLRSLFSLSISLQRKVEREQREIERENKRCLPQIKNKDGERMTKSRRNPPWLREDEIETRTTMTMLQARFLVKFKREGMIFYTWFLWRLENLRERFGNLLYYPLIETRTMMCRHRVRWHSWPCLTSQPG